MLPGVIVRAQGGRQSKDFRILYNKKKSKGKEKKKEVLCTKEVQSAKRGPIWTKEVQSASFESRVFIEN